MDLHIYENLFSVHTERFVDVNLTPSYCIRVKLSVEPALKSYLDSKPYHRFENVSLNIAFNRPLLTDKRTTIGIRLDGPEWQEKDPLYAKHEDFLQRAIDDELVYQFESEEQQFSIEEEVVHSIYSHYKRPIRIYLESLENKDEEEFVLTYRF